MFDGVKGSLCGVFCLIDFVREDFPVLAQGYCVLLSTWVCLDDYGLCPVLCGGAAVGCKRQLVHLTHTLSGGNLLWGSWRSPHCQGQCWDYLDDVLVVLKGG